jgi:hypothetical protein
MRALVCLVSWLVLVGCSQDDLLQKFSSPGDQAIAKGYIDHLRAGRFEEIEKAADPGIRNPNFRAWLTRMAELVPVREPASVKVVGAQRFHASGTTTVNTTFEYDFGDKWLLANVAIQETNGTKTILALNVKPLPQSLQSLNKFTLVGKGVGQYAVLVAAIAAVLITVYALIICARTTLPRRKWLWIVFILLGFGKIAVDWTTGEWDIAPLAVQLLSASAFAPPYGAWTIAVSVPVGALMFLIRRKRLVSQVAGK